MADIPPSECHLLKLPPELRLRIYDSVFAVQSFVSRIDVNSDGVVWDVSKIRKPVRTALLLACKTVHEEACPILCRCAHFYFHFHHEYQYTPTANSHLQSLNFVRRCEKARIFVWAGKRESNGDIQTQPLPAITSFVEALGADLTKPTLLTDMKIALPVGCKDLGFTERAIEGLMGARFRGKPYVYVRHEAGIAREKLKAFYKKFRGS